MNLYILQDYPLARNLFNIIYYDVVMIYYFIYSFTII
eukprot:UN03215